MPVTIIRGFAVTQSAREPTFGRLPRRRDPPRRVVELTQEPLPNPPAQKHDDGKGYSNHEKKPPPRHSSKSSRIVLEEIHAEET